MRDSDQYLHLHIPLIRLHHQFITVPTNFNLMTLQFLYEETACSSLIYYQTFLVQSLRFSVCKKIKFKINNSKIYKISVFLKFCKK